MTRAEIVGRDTELAAVSHFFERSADGIRALVLEGAAGIGKSTLWVAAVEIAHSRGARVLSSRPAEAESELDFAGLSDLFEDILEDVLPSLTPPRRRALEIALLIEEATEPADARALGVAVRTALETLAAGDPLILAIDDVQWLDPSSARALSFALRRLDADVLLLFARRLDEPVASSVDLSVELTLPDNLVERLPIGALSVGAIQALLRDRLDLVVTRPMLLRIHELSGGNPFYALELGRALPPDIDPTRPLPLPDSLGELISARLRQLPATTRDALALVAAVGNASDAVLEAAGVSVDLLEPARAAHVVAREDGVTRFTHPLLASALYQDLSPEERRDVHRRVADVSNDAVERARHLALASSSADSEVASLLESASMQARARGTSIAAADLAEHALRLTPSHASEDRHRRTIAAARSHLESGDMHRARRLANEALERASAGERAEALVLLSDVAFAAADVDGSLALRREALEAAVEQPRLQSEIHGWLAGQAALTESIESCLRHALAARQLANSLDDDELRAGASTVFAHAHFRMGKPDAIQLLEKAVELTAATENQKLHRYAVSGLIHAAVWSHQFDRARSLLDERDREWGGRDELVKAWNLWFRGLLELRAGDLRLAEAHAKGAREIRRQYELDDREDMGSVWLLAMIAAHRGELGRARAFVDDYRPSTEGTWLDGVRGLVELWSGHPGAAVTSFETAELGTRALRGEEPALSWWRPDHAEALIELGRVDEAVALLEAWESASLRLGRNALLAQVTRCRGLISASRGDLAEAEATLQRAIAQLEAADDPFGRARALLALGIVRRRARQRRTAKEAIQEAGTLFEACGAEGWAERTRSEIGRIGGRRREEGLTAAERRVAALVAEGRTNREVATALFVGERTVETHLSHIYAKLGVRSRTELARTLMSVDNAQSSGVSSISS